MSDSSSIPDPNPDPKQQSLLIITHESVGEKMAGPGVRAWEMARALGKNGLPVTLASPFPSARLANNVTIARYSWDVPASIETLIGQANTVLGIGPVISRIVNTLGKPIEKPVIVDTYYVPEIEQILLNLTLQPGGIDPTSVYVNDMLTYLRQGDFFLCASERHRDFWLGALLATERLNMRTLADFTIDHLIGIAPLGLPDESPIPSNDSVMKGVIAGIGRDDKVIYWGGGIWDWTDPIALLDALKLVLLQRDDVRIVFGALHHYENKIVPVMSVAQQLMNYAAREGWLNTRIFFLDWVPYDERSQYLLEADIGISLTLRTIENRYAVRARSLDYLWTSLPCILTTGDELADVLKGIGLATQVQPGDVQAIANAILKILGDATPRARFRQQNETVIEAWRWSTLVKATLDFSIHPRLSQDSQTARERIGALVQARTSWDMLTTKLHILNQEKFDIQSQFAEVQTEAATLHTQLEQLRKHLNLVERGKVMRTLNALQQGIKKIRGNHS